MRKLLSCVVLVATLIVPAYGQQEKMFTITLTQAEVVLVARALQSLPYREVNELLIKLQGQIDPQLEAEAGSTTAPAPASESEPTK